jgi:uncharacterized damage-inducible protein DinB
MDRLGQLRLMAAYNADMNQKMIAACRRLPAAELLADRKAFFGSLLGTLEHLVRADTVWMQRFAAHPAAFPALAPVAALPKVTSTAGNTFTGVDDYAERRVWLDAVLSAFIGQVTDADLDINLHTTNMKGEPQCRSFYPTLLHVFNHQTHHRGQATTLLSQAGVDIGVTDLLALVPQAEMS